MIVLDAKRALSDDVLGDGFAADEMFLHDLLGLVRRNLAVGNLGRIANRHFNDRFPLAHSNTAGLRNDDSAQIIRLDLTKDRFHRLAGAGGDSARTHPNDDLCIA